MRPTWPSTPGATMATAITVPLATASPMATNLLPHPLSPPSKRLMSVKACCSISTDQTCLRHVSFVCCPSCAAVVTMKCTIKRVQSWHAPLIFTGFGENKHLHIFTMHQIALISQEMIAVSLGHLWWITPVLAVLLATPPLAWIYIYFSVVFF